jgi:hypothetical protein
MIFFFIKIAVLVLLINVYLPKNRSPAICALVMSCEELFFTVFLFEWSYSIEFVITFGLSYLFFGLILRFSFALLPWALTLVLLNPIYVPKLAFFGLAQIINYSKVSSSSEFLEYVEEIGPLKKSYNSKVKNLDKDNKDELIKEIDEFIELTEDTLDIYEDDLTKIEKKVMKKNIQVFKIERKKIEDKYK